MASLTKADADAALGRRRHSNEVMSPGSGDMRTAGGGDPGLTMSGRRRTLVWALIVLASLIAITSALTTWVHRQMLDEQSWRNASARLIEDPEVRSAVSVYVV